MNLLNGSAVAAALIFCAGCGLKPGQFTGLPKDQRPFTNSCEPSVIYLVGDAGKLPASGDKPAPLRHLSFELKQHPGSSVVFLGDNIYPEGLPDSLQNPSEYRQAAAALSAQVEVLKNNSSQALFIPGNHDWADSYEWLNKPDWGKADEGENPANPAREGWENLLRQQAFIRRTAPRTKFLPAGACPGPEVWLPDSHLTVVALDTQWWLHTGEKPLTECGLAAENQWFSRLADTLKKYAGRKIIVVGHHPLFSSGPHGGGFTFNQHLFPLTDFNPKAYVPLPAVGSLYVGWRSLRGPRQDVSNPRYQTLKKQLLQIFTQHPGLVYVSGHDHHLGYYQHELQHYIVSGAGSKTATSVVKRKKGTEWVMREQGFVKLLYYPAERKTLIEFYACTYQSMRMLWRKEL